MVVQRVSKRRSTPGISAVLKKKTYPDSGRALLSGGEPR
jgi:hypothetical protein